MTTKDTVFKAAEQESIARKTDAADSFLPITFAVPRYGIEIKTERGYVSLVPVDKEFGAWEALSDEVFHDWEGVKKK